MLTMADLWSQVARAVAMGSLPKYRENFLSPAIVGAAGCGGDSQAPRLPAVPNVLSVSMGSSVYPPGFLVC